MAARLNAEIKNLETRRNKLQSERKHLNIEVSEKQQSSSHLKIKIEKLQKQIEKLKSEKGKDIIISEHAILRYIERVIGINISEIEEKILPMNRRENIQQFGDCTIKNEDYKLIIKGGVVVTIED